MSEEIKKTQPEPVEQPVELAEQELDKVAGGKNYFESRSNTSVSSLPAPKQPPTTQPVVPKPAAG